MGFSDIKGQSFAVTLIQRAIENNRLASTYLFYGPKGVGKELAARVFAKALNCEELTGDACDRCRSCTHIDKKGHPDINWFYPVGASRSIRIEQVRQLQRAISWKAYEGRVKVGIIVDADTLTPEAGNALLKTLEEPPPNSIFILISSLPEAILPTIRSRAQEIQFFNLPPSIVAELLEHKIGLSRQEAIFYSQLSIGSVGKVLELRDEDIFNRRKMILDILVKGSFSNMGELMEKVQEIIDNLQQFKEDLLERSGKEGETETSTSPQRQAYIAGEYRRQVEEVLGLILSWYRDILIFQTTHKPESVLNRDYLDKIKYWEDKFNIDELEEKIRVIEDIKEALGHNVNLKLLLQVMFIRLGLI